MIAVMRKIWLSVAGILVSFTAWASEPSVVMPIDPKVPSFLPGDSSGHQFVVYGDCCTSTPGTLAREVSNFASVNAVVARLQPGPEFICFLGDNIVGSKDHDLLRSEWDYWFVQMAWSKHRDIPVYVTTSNHNTFDRDSERVFR